MKVKLIKTAAGYLIPASEDDADALRAVKIGQVLNVEAKKMRNYKFHKKFFALMNLAFDQFEPEPISYKYAPEKNREQFRKDVIILAGHWVAYTRLDGSTRIEAKSISFGSMKEEEFKELYSKVIDVLLKRVLTNYTKSDLNNVIDQIMDFT